MFVYDFVDEMTRPAGTCSGDSMLDEIAGTASICVEDACLKQQLKTMLTLLLWGAASRGLHYDR